MSGPPPGHPMLVNIGNNPNINQDPGPPPPLPEGFAMPIHIEVQAGGPPPNIGVVMNGAAPGTPIALANGVAPGPPPPGPPPPYAAAPVGPPLMQMPPPMMGPGFMGNGFGMGMGGFGMGMGMGITPQGFPPVPERNSGVSPLPGMGNWGSGFAPPPFAPGMPPWAAGSAGFMPGMGMGMSMGFPGMFPFQKPPPWMIDGHGGSVGPLGGEQRDPTIKPGGDLPGHTVVQPAETSSLLRILTNFLPWEQTGMPLHIEPMQFDSGWTLNRVIAAMRKPNNDNQGWGLTQCIELGGGRWAKGMTWVYGSHQATEQTLGMVGMGSNSNREPNAPKVYVYVHRI